MAVLTDEQLEARCLARYEANEEFGRSNLLAYIPHTSPQFESPKALEPICKLYDRIHAGERVYACIEGPPRHGKSEVIFHGSARELRYHPTKRLAYISYSGEIAGDQSRLAKRRAAAAGVKFELATRAGGARLDPSAAIRHWQTSAGGGFLAVGRDGGIVSKGVDLLHFDDPYKNRAEAESQLVSDDVWEKFKGDLFPRLEPKASVMITHQRWNDNDLIARIRAEVEAGRFPKFEFITLPAINDRGEALWPERYDLEALAMIRATTGEYNWWSQYMQQPRPKGGRIFNDRLRYGPPAQLGGRRIVIAADTAGTTRTSSDYTAIVVAAFYDAPWTSPEGIFFPRMPHADVLRVYRFQMEVPDVTRLLGVIATRWPGAPVVIESQGGDGRSVAQTLRRIDRLLPVHAVKRVVDKFTAAQPVAAASNQGRWRVPTEYDPKMDSKVIEKVMRELGVWDEGLWIAPYQRELDRFTGAGSRKDDQVDASAHCWDYGSLPPPPPKKDKRSKRKMAEDGGF